MASLQLAKEPLKDKRDDKFIQLTSNTYFFEVFSKKGLKIQEIIPQTIIWDSGNPTKWFFSSSKSNEVLLKASEKLTHFEICKSFLSISQSEDMRIDSLPQLLEYTKKQKHSDEVCIVKYVDKKIELLNGSQLVQLFIEGKSTNIQILQAHVKTISKFGEVYYAEYRHDENTLPQAFKFLKKAIQPKKSTSMVQLQPLPNNLNAPNATKEKKNVISNFSITYFKSFDAQINLKLQEMLKRLVEFIEKAFKLKVRKLMIKCIQHISGVLYFIGIKHLYIDLFSYAPYDIEAIRESKSLTFEEFRLQAKLSKKQESVKLAGVHIKLPAVIKQDDKSYSSTLYKKMRVEKCGGDFCDYEMLEKNSGPLAISKMLLEEQKRKKKLKIEQFENIAVLLPYEISNQLILRTREQAVQIVELLLKNKIFSKQSVVAKSQNYSYSGEDNVETIDIQQEYPFIKKSYKTDNYENQYKRIKICSACFTIYQLTSKHFDQQLKETILNSSKINNSTRNSQSKSQLTQILNFSTQESISETKNLQHSKNNSILSKTNYSLSKIQRNKSNLSQLIPHTRKDIEVNRLSLGYLNYEKIRTLYNEPKEDINFLNATDPPKKKAINLFTKPYQVELKRRDINGDSYLLFKLAEERKNLRKNANNDQEMRQLLLNKMNESVLLGKEPTLITTSSLYYNHANFQHLRNIHKFKMNSPLKPFLEEYDIDLIPEITIEKCCQLMGYELPSNSNEIRMMTIDKSTAIPYILLQQKEEKEENEENNSEGKINEDILNGNNRLPLNAMNIQNQNQNDQNTGNNKNAWSGQEIIVFMHDFFDSFLEYQPILVSFLTKNRKFILLNLPGQSYTVFDKNASYSNNYYLEVIDRLLYQLDSSKEISTDKDKIKFIGIGHGGNILQNYLVQAQGYLAHMSSILLINSFSEVDSILRESLMQSQQVFTTCKEVSMCFNYFSVLVNSQPLSESRLEVKMKINPIISEGRVSIINGILASQSVKDRFVRLPIKCYIVHSLKNCVVNINQSDILSKYESGNDLLLTKNLQLQRANEQLNLRKLKYIDGGHSLLEDNEILLKDTIEEFLEERY